MTNFTEQINKLSNLAYLDKQKTENLSKDLIEMLEFVEKLKKVDTTNINPLMHPLDLLTPLREDNAIDCNLNDALKKAAPKFLDNLYLVPKVISNDL